MSETTTSLPLDEPGVTLAVTPPEPKTERADIAYVILVKVEEAGKDGRWTVGATLTAKGADAAIRQYAESLGAAIPAGGATLVAIASRSWREVSVKAQTVTTLVIEEA